MKRLIVFFSREHENYVNGQIKDLETGNTEVVARIIRQLTEADIFKIEPLQPYSKSYNECIAEAQADQKRGARPELKTYPASVDEYETIYLGYPNYWGTMPMAVFTFLEHFDFEGKVIKPFCTHEGSGMGNSIKDIKQLCPGATVEDGLLLCGCSVNRATDEIKRWLDDEKATTV